MLEASLKQLLINYFEKVFREMLTGIFKDNLLWGAHNKRQV